jgi:hypothetical protein
VIVSATRLGVGAHLLEFVIVKDDGLGGEGLLRRDGEELARNSVERFTSSGLHGVGAGLTCGKEWGPPVGTGCETPVEYAASILRAFVETRGPVVGGPLADLEAILAEQ